MEIFKLVLEIEGKKTPILVKNSTNCVNNKLNLNNKSIEYKLKCLGLEQVYLNDILPKFKKVSGNIISDNCSVCYNNYIDGEYYRKLKCNHYFHKKCIDKWLKLNPICPICRKDII